MNTKEERSPVFLSPEEIDALLSKNKKEEYKTGEHKRLPIEKANERFNRDMNRTKDLLSNALVIHLWFEFWINEVNLLKFPKENLGKSRFRGFGDKLSMLERIDFFDKSPQLLSNIKQIQQIRNRFAHTLLEYTPALSEEDEIDSIVKKKILGMKSVFGKDPIYDRKN